MKTHLIKSYPEALQCLYERALFHKVKWGLKNAYRLSEKLAHPQKNYPCIHVAGSNGKGSVATKIAEGFRLAGYRTGLYTSPHLSTFRERIQINDILISEEEVIDGLRNIEDEEATFFEITTFLALDYFRKRHVEIAVIEAGLGGTLDTTNIINPILSIITSISLEHTHILGDTIEKIAEEKAGIIKKDTPVIVGPKAAFLPIMDKAFEMKSSIIFVPPIAIENYEKENTEIARVALSFLRKTFPKIDRDIIMKTPPCRFEFFSKERVLLDVAHNPEAFEALFKRIREDFPHEKVHAIVGFSNDKDIEKCLSILDKHTAFIHFTEAKNPRACPAIDLMKRLNKDCSGLLSSFSQAIKKAKDENALLLVTGTFYIMEEIRRFLHVKEPSDPIMVHEFSLEQKVP